jgi:hypothetical protein
MFATAGTSQLGDCFILDLPDTLAGEIKSFSYIFQTQRMIYTDAKEKADHIFLPLGQCFEAAFYFHPE